MNDASGTWTVLVTAPQFAEPGLGILRDAGCEVLVLTGSKDKAEVDAILSSRKVHAVISRTIQLDGATLEACPSLRVVSKHGVGVNNIDVAAASRLGIPVTSTPGVNAQSVAELTLGLMLSAARRIPWLDQEVKHGRWTRLQDGFQLAGRTLGLVGFGDVGRRVGLAASALGMQVVAFDPLLVGKDAPDGVTLCPRLEELLGRADVLSLHVPLSAATERLIGRQALAALPDGAILVNTSRGPVIDETALIEALGSGKLRAAALDTVAHEPIRPDDPLLGLDNLILTPHVGGSTLDALSGVGEAAARNALSVLRGEMPEFRVQVNPEVFGATIGSRS